MGQTVVASAVALATAVIVALWNVGGRGALERRTMRQELEIAAALHPGPEREHLEELALDRATLYVDRRAGAELSPTSVRRLAALTAAMPVVIVVLSVLAGPEGSALAEVAWVLLFVALVVLGGLLGYWTSRVIRRRRSRSRGRRLEEARRRLDTPAG